MILWHITFKALSVNNCFDIFPSIGAQYSFGIL